MRPHLPAVAALWLLLTACGGSSPAQPERTAAPTSTSVPPTVSFALKAPPVRVPLSASAFAGRECDTLTPAQRTALGIYRASPGYGTPACNFVVRVPGEMTVVAEVLVSGSGQGLTSIYTLQEQRELWRMWEPTEVDGYPAVLFSKYPRRPGMVCEAGVGVADTQYIWVRYYYYDEHDGQDTCAPAERVAAEVLATIKANS